MNNFIVKTSGLNLGDNNSVKILMVLHGWGMNSHVWEPIRERLEARFHVLWIDLPGHGFNRHIDAKSLDNMVGLIAEITPDNTHILAWSLGGLVAQGLENKFSQHQPNKIKSMTLVTSTPRFSQTENNNWKHAMSHDVLHRFAENLKQDSEKTLKGFIALQFIGVKDAKKTQTELINHILKNEKTIKKVGGVILDNDMTEKAQLESQGSNIPTEEALDVGLNILKHADLRSVNPNCPQHWIFSEYDRLIPKEVINDLISLRPNAEITLIERAGHAPFITHSDAFLKHTLDFIEAVG